MKKIFVIHHHLNPGGVTRIIHSQLKSLSHDKQKIFVLTGFCPDYQWFEFPHSQIVEFQALNYLEQIPYPAFELKQKLNEILIFLKEQISREDVMHIHNPNLGKNPIFTYAVYLMAKDGYKIVNHAHDFAEDRSKNLDFLSEIIENGFGESLQKVMYPNLDNYIFIVLNSADKQRLIKYGVNSGRIHWLPNPVSFPEELETNGYQARQEIIKSLKLNKNKKIVTYPVRVIQRKNIGEYILLSVLFSDEANWIVTQAPKNPKEIVPYEKWLDFCRQNKIDIHFEAGNHIDFEMLLKASDFCITTSYMEGFGMVYLEPWLMGTPVTGRDIEWITQDFKKDGIKFASLYNKLVVKVNNKQLDFKDLEMSDQMDFIRNIKKSKDLRKKFFDWNPSVINLFARVEDDIIEHNKSVIKNAYSIEKYGKRLLETYSVLS